MNFVWFDYESSGARVNFDNVLEAAIILTDDRFKILEKIEIIIGVIWLLREKRTTHL